MRISTTAMQRQAVSAMLEQQSALAKTQQQVASGERIAKPSDDPIGSQRVLELDNALGRLTQFRTNAGLLTTRLQLEETALGSASDVMQRVRELVVQGSNATQSDDTRQIIATEIRQLRDELVAIANSQDGQGDYLFAGFKTTTRPFSPDANGVTYNGDQGQRYIQVGDNQFVSDADSGAEVFQLIRDGNGTFSATTPTANQGGVVVNQTSVVDPGAYDQSSFSIRFTSESTFDVVDSSDTIISSSTYSDGNAIEYAGLKIQLSGVAQTGDRVDIAPSANQDAFQTLDKIASALEMPNYDEATSAQARTALNQGLYSLDQSLDQLLETRTEVGSRLNRLETQEASTANLEIQLKQTRSDIRDLDYAEAITRLNLQLTGLQAAQQSYAKIQGLSLFRYL